MLEQFGPYALIERLGLGGMAEVYLARTTAADGTSRKVAIKRLLHQHSRDKAFATMFADEARITSRLVHPNIARLYDFGEVEERAFIAMEYVEGKELPDVIAPYDQRGMPVPMVLYIGRSVAEALAHAHEMTGDDGRCLNIVHRDISPQNVLVAYSGEVKLIDFGIAKAKNRLEETVGGVVKGKFAYMSPEQVEGGALDGRSDVFSLGIVLWEMLSGRSLFAHDNALTMASNVLSAEVPALQQYNPAVTAPLEAAVRRALERKLTARWGSSAELAAALAQLAEDRMMYSQRDMAAWMQRTFRALGAATLVPGVSGEPPTVEHVAPPPPPSGSLLGGVGSVAGVDAADFGYGDEDDATRADLSEPLFAPEHRVAGAAGPAWRDQSTAIDAVGEPGLAPGSLLDDDDDAETRADLRSWAGPGPQARPGFEQASTAPVPELIVQRPSPALADTMADPTRGQRSGQPPGAVDPAQAPTDPMPAQSGALDALPTPIHVGGDPGFHEESTRLLDDSSAPRPRGPQNTGPPMPLGAGAPSRPTTGPPIGGSPAIGAPQVRPPISGPRGEPPVPAGPPGTGYGAQPRAPAEVPTFEVQVDAVQHVVLQEAGAGRGGRGAPLWFWVVLGALLLLGAGAAALLLLL